MSYQYREFYERGKPILILDPPLYTYETRRLLDDLFANTLKLTPPFDCVFHLIDGFELVTVRASRTCWEVQTCYSINNGQFIYHQDYASYLTILRQLDCALHRGSNDPIMAS